MLGVRILLSVLVRVRNCVLLCLCLVGGATFELVPIPLSCGSWVCIRLIANRLCLERVAPTVSSFIIIHHSSFIIPSSHHPIIHHPSSIIKMIYVRRLPDECAETHMTGGQGYCATAGQNTSSHMVMKRTSPAISRGVDTLHGLRREIRRGKQANGSCTET